MKKYETESSIFKALGHPVRLKIIEGLLCDNCCVNKIVEKLNLPQSTVSQHLGILKNAGIIAPHKDGVVTCYKVENAKVMKIMSLMKE
ncbi:MAG: winged helix-turn-helix transcriptional regulator [Spirochaetes bacterium]|nr:winged helix-turn-helix transcriptional regulator [Spirochaetota bacterium]